MSYEFPTLKGSEKQVSWATDIRSEYIGELTRCGVLFDQLVRGESPEDDLICECLDAVFGNDDAKWWIECRMKRRALPCFDTVFAKLLEEN